MCVVFKLPVLNYSGLLACERGKFWKLDSSVNALSSWNLDNITVFSFPTEKLDCRFSRFGKMIVYDV